MPPDPAILFVKPKAIKGRDKRALQQAGVIVVEIENPHEPRFVRAMEVPQSQMLAAAMRAIRDHKEGFSPTVVARLGLAVCDAILKERDTA